MLFVFSEMLLLVFSQIIPFYSRRNKNGVYIYEDHKFCLIFLWLPSNSQICRLIAQLFALVQRTRMLMMMMVIAMMMMVMIRRWTLKNWRLSNAKYKPSDGWWRTNKIDNWNGINWDKIHHQLNRKMQKNSFYLKFFTTRGNKRLLTV